eukprot:m.41730 g.41730  ORF g.41730 m.41730 type:complete len:60 (-) comp10452_c0_seq3:586-765(-)
MKTHWVGINGSLKMQKCVRVCASVQSLSSSILVILLKKIRQKNKSDNERNNNTNNQAKL